MLLLIINVDSLTLGDYESFGGTNEEFSWSYFGLDHLDLIRISFSPLRHPPQGKSLSHF
jgi:hypothetical protein